MLILQKCIFHRGRKAILHVFQQNEERTLGYSRDQTKLRHEFIYNIKDDINFSAIFSQ